MQEAGPVPRQPERAVLRAEGAGRDFPHRTSRDACGKPPHKPWAHPGSRRASPSPPNLHQDPQSLLPEALPVRQPPSSPKAFTGLLPGSSSSPRNDAGGGLSSPMGCIRTLLKQQTRHRRTLLPGTGWREPARTPGTGVARGGNPFLQATVLGRWMGVRGQAETPFAEKGFRLPPACWLRCRCPFRKKASAVFRPSFLFLARPCLRGRRAAVQTCHAARL